MMRHARTASLLVAFCLLTSAATAYAECSWILWNVRQGEYTPIASYDERARCIENIANMAKSAEETGQLLGVWGGIVKFRFIRLLSG